MANHRYPQYSFTFLSAVFAAPGYVLPTEQWADHLPSLHIAFGKLPTFQQSLLQHYYATGCSQSELAKVFAIGAHRCGRELRQALHSLRKAANPLYCAAL